MGNENDRSLEEHIKKWDEFEKTVSELLDKIKEFKSALRENLKKFGPDTSKWRGSGKAKK